AGPADAPGVQLGRRPAQRDDVRVQQLNVRQDDGHLPLDRIQLRGRRLHEVRERGNSVLNGNDVVHWVVFLSQAERPEQHPPELALRWVRAVEVGTSGSPHPRPYAPQYAERTDGRGSRRSNLAASGTGPSYCAAPPAGPYRRCLDMSSVHTDLPRSQGHVGRGFLPRGPSFRLGETGPTYAVVKEPALPSSPFRSPPGVRLAHRESRTSLQSGAHQ